MICAVIKGPSFEQAHLQLAQAQKKCSLAELRLDFFHALDFNALANLKKAFALPMIFTLRVQSQGGAFQGTEEERRAAIKKLAALQPAYLDLEATLAPDFVKQLKSDNPGVKWIVSFHDFEKMAPLAPLLEQMQKLPADLYKIAVRVNSSAEALHLLEFMQAHPKVLAMGMGPYGPMTRILSPRFGGAFVYASLSEEESTAPGQVAVDELKRYGTTPSAALYGLIGDPLDKSLSHISHNALMNALQLSSVYVKFPVALPQLSDFLKMARKIGIRGLSVTMPLKERVIEYLDEIDPWAKKVGAVNTLRFEEGRIKGFNTDGKGALNALDQVRGKKIVILGAGGASKAVAAEALERGAQVIVLNRDEKKSASVGPSAWL